MTPPTTAFLETEVIGLHEETGVGGGGREKKKRALLFLQKCIDREGLGKRRTGTRLNPPLKSLTAAWERVKHFYLVMLS